MCDDILVSLATGVT